MEYLYKCDYTRLTKDNASALVLHVHVYQLADMYDIAELKEVAARLFKETAEKDWELPAFPLAVQEIYDNPEDDERTLRKLVVNEATQHLEALLKDDHGEFAQVMAAFGEFGKDVCKDSFRGPNLNRNVAFYYCEYSCNWSWRIDQRKASKSFQVNPRCPRDKYVLVKTDVNKFGLSYNNFECDKCKFVMGSMNTSSQSNWFCPACDEKSYFSYKKP